MKRIRNLTLFFIVSMSIGLSGVFGWLCWQQALQFVEVPRIVLNTSPLDYGISDYETIEVTTSDNLTLRGWYIAPTRADGATIIFLHGQGGHLRDLMPEAILYTDMGYGALLFDLRGHGASDDAPVTMGINEVLDVEAMFQFLLTQNEVNPERIAIYGNSMGASIALLSAEQIPDIRVVIADAPYSSIYNALRDGIPRQIGIPALFFPDIIIGMSNYLSGENFYTASPIDSIMNVHQPVLFIHGTNDGRIPYTHSEALFNVANEPKELYLVEGSGHTNNYEYDVESYQAIVIPFLEKYLANG